MGISYSISGDTFAFQASKAFSLSSKLIKAQSPRSSFENALRCVSRWNDYDRRVFVQAFTTQKSSDQIASELGVDRSDFLEHKRSLIRRFMYAAKN